MLVLLDWLCGFGLGCVLLCVGCLANSSLMTLLEFEFSMMLLSLGLLKLVKVDCVCLWLILIVVCWGLSCLFVGFTVSLFCY